MSPPPLQVAPQWFKRSVSDASASFLLNSPHRSSRSPCPETRGKKRMNELRAS